MRPKLLAVLCILTVLGFVAPVAAQSKKGTNYAFLVACSEYREGQFKKLPYAYKETEDFRQALLATGFDDKNIVFLHDNRTEQGGRFLPHKENILEELDVLAARLTKDDTLVVLFDGHGLHFKGDKGSYFCPTNVKLDRKDTMVPLDGDKGVYALLQNCKAGHGGKLLLVNACRNDPDPLNQAATKDTFDNEAKELLPEGVAALFSCSPGQKCYYYPPSAKIERSLFMNHLIEAWQGTYAKGEQLTLEDVFKEVRSKAAEDAAKLFGEKQIAVIDRKYSGEWVVSKGAAGRSPLGMKFVRVPKGTFYMGGGGGKAGKKTEIAEDFEIAVYTVTQGQWQELMGDNPSSFRRGGDEAKAVEKITDADLKQFPVENVSWDDVQKFIKKLNEQNRGSGFLYRLPKEAEWEYACRGGATSEEECSYHFYFDKPTNELTSKSANFDGNFPYPDTAAKGEYLARPTKVGSYKPNKLGLYDMHGNVWQWCDDLDGASDRVLRGGCWISHGVNCRAALRSGLAPSNRYNFIGFRLARVPSRP